MQIADDQHTERARTNRKCAQIINSYWAAKGVKVNARLERVRTQWTNKKGVIESSVLDFVIVSDMRNDFSAYRRIPEMADA